MNTPSASSLPQPTLTPIPGTDPDAPRLCRLETSYVIHLPYTGRWLAVRAGYETDGASIPRFAWSLIEMTPFDPNCTILGATHDPLYEAQLFDDLYGDDSRHQADKELYHLMCANGPIASDKARLFFDVVHDAGEEVWDRHTEESIADARKYAALFDSEEDAWTWAHQIAG